MADIETGAAPETAAEVKAQPAERAERADRGERTERRERYNSEGGRSQNRRRRKVCQFCVDKAQSIDYKDVAKLKRFVSERAKILPRRTTGVCAPHQRQLMEAIKRARVIALMPYVSD